MTIGIPRRPLPLLGTRRRQPADGAAPIGAENAASSDLDVAERRAAVLRRLFPKLFNWYATASEWSLALEVQQYLAQATNLTDLENRIRRVEQQTHFRV